MSSSFELRLGQPSQQTHALRGPLQPSLDPQVSNATMERHKPIFLERMLQRGNANRTYRVRVFLGCSDINCMFLYKITFTVNRKNLK